MSTDAGTMRDQAYTLILNKIIHQELPFGSRLSVAKLSREFGLSNTPIREAISLLESEGLVTYNRNSGFRVIHLDQKVFDDLCQTMRALLVGSLYDSILKGRIPALIEMLEQRLDVQKSMLEQNSFYEYAQYSIDFDRSFIDITNDRMLSMMFESKFNLLSMCTIYVYDYRSDGVSANLYEHEEILRALKEGRLHDAGKLLYLHFDKSDIRIIS